MTTALTLLGLLVAPTAWAGWLPPVAISQGNGNGGPPRVVLDSAGNATAVWDRWNGSDTVVESAFRPAGEAWEPPVALSEVEGEGEPPGAHDAQSPQIAVDGAGNVTVVWERYGGTNKLLIEAAYRPVDGGWEAPVQVGEVHTMMSPEPWIAVDEAGDATAVWKGGEVIWAASRPAGGAWQSPVAVSGEDSYVPQAAVSADGDVTVTWMHFDGSHYVVQSAYRPAGGSWETPTVVSRPEEQAGDPFVAIDANGDSLIAWRGNYEGKMSVRAVYRPSGGSWGEPTDVSSEGEEAEAMSVRTAVDTEGNAIVAWSGNQGGLGGWSIVKAAYKPHGGEWETPVALSATGGNGYPSDVVFDQSGNAALVWQRAGGSSNIVQASYRPSGGEWEAAVNLSGESGQAVDPVVVLDAPGDATAADGDATAVWLKGSTVQAAGYDPTGVLTVEMEAPEEAEAGEPVEFKTPTEGLYSPELEFGDGESVAATAATHTYEQPGEYEVRLSGAEELGYRSSVVQKIDIVPSGTLPGSEGGEPPLPQGGTTPPPIERQNVAAESISVSPSPDCEAATTNRSDALRRFRFLQAKLRRARGGIQARRLRSRTQQLLAVLHQAQRVQDAACA